MLVALLLFAVAAGLALAGVLFITRRRLIVLLQRTQVLSDDRRPGVFPWQALDALEAWLDRLGTQEHRWRSTHAISGLPTREPLADRMACDAEGTLALLSCRDYDRLCAFDPALADRVLVQIVDRLTAMLPPGRFLAQVDRSHLALWAGPLVTYEEASAEIEALAYALGGRLIDDGREILPEIAFRKARFIAATSPQALVSQLLSSFSVSPPASAAPEAGADIASLAQERFQVEQDLRHAVARNEFRMQYQPLVDAARGRVCGAEALIRWEHPERGRISPSRFIPLAEAAGLTEEIGLWALNQAARDARTWQQAGLEELRVAVNVSAHQLATEHLATLVARTLERHRLPGQALEVELTESVALGDGARPSQLCEELRLLGVQIAIDDFGTGYSSLSALRSLTFDKLKIDRTFVTDVDQRRDSQAICSSLFALGRGLGIKILAEGVETEAEYRWLRGHGCQLFQGFFFASPMDNPQFIEFASNPQALAGRLTVGEAPEQLRLRA